MALFIAFYALRIRPHRILSLADKQRAMLTVLSMADKKPDKLLS